MNAHSVYGKLVKAGILPKSVYISEEPEVEDDAVVLSETLHVTVGCYGAPYMNVVKTLNEGTDDVEFEFYPVRFMIEDIIADLRKAGYK